MQWLIDHHGVSWPGSTHRIASWTPNCDPLSYAVSELGFTHIRLASGAMVVRFNPSRIKPCTAISAFYLLADTRPRRVVLLYGNEARNTEILGSAGQAIQRIEEVVGSQLSCGTATMSVQRRSLNHPIKTFEQPIAALLRAWAETGGRWSAEREANFHEPSLATTLGNGRVSAKRTFSCEGTGVAPIVPKTLTSSGAKRGLFTRQDFIYSAEHDHYTCPAGAELTKIHRRADHTQDFDRYRHLSACFTCPLRRSARDR
jgi:hypothetical protein